MRSRGRTARRKAPDASEPTVGPSRRLDYELELGTFVARPNALGEPVSIENAEEHVFGLVLLNDWSARDIQAWEYQPLGPFLSKSFATTVSPWMVTLEALRPFRSPFTRPSGDPAPLPYLDAPANTASGAFDITLEAWLQTERMRANGHAGDRLSTSNFQGRVLDRGAARRASHGQRVQPAERRSARIRHALRSCAGRGRLAARAQCGREAPLQLSSEESRTFLEDGDTVILRAYCERPGFRRIGFGECRGSVLPPRAGARR